MNPAKRGPVSCVEPVFFPAQRRADLGQIIDEGRALSFIGKRRAIFDSLVADLLPTQGYDGQAFMGRFGMEAKSANIELCVICRSSLKSKIQIGQTLRKRAEIIDPGYSRRQ